MSLLRMELHYQIRILLTEESKLPLSKKFDEVIDHSVKLCCVDAVNNIYIIRYFNSRIVYLSFIDYIPICPELTHIACNSTVKNPVCISPNQICDYHRDCPGGEDESDCLAYKRCNFQTDMCDWMTSKKVVYEWKRYDNHSTYQTFITSRVNPRSIFALLY